MGQPDEFSLTPISSPRNDDLPVMIGRCSVEADKLHAMIHFMLDWSAVSCEDTTRVCSSLVERPLAHESRTYPLPRWTLYQSVPTLLRVLLQFGYRRQQQCKAILRVARMSRSHFAPIQLALASVLLVSGQSESLAVPPVVFCTWSEAFFAIAFPSVLSYGMICCAASSKRFLVCFDSCEASGLAWSTRPLLSFDEVSLDREMSLEEARCLALTKDTSHPRDHRMEDHNHLCRRVSHLDPVRCGKMIAVKTKVEMKHQCWMSEGGDDKFFFSSGPRRQKDTKQIMEHGCRLWWKHEDHHCLRGDFRLVLCSWFVESKCQPEVCFSRPSDVHANSVVTELM